MTLEPLVGPWPLFQFLNPIHHWTGESARRKAATYTQDNTNTSQTRIQIFMPRVGREPTTTVFVWRKTVHALDQWY
jgi:hypothetical protein